VLAGDPAWKDDAYAIEERCGFDPWEAEQWFVVNALRFK
jgi:hypothetical protein